MVLSTDAGVRCAGSDDVDGAGVMAIDLEDCKAKCDEAKDCRFVSFFTNDVGIGGNDLKCLRHFTCPAVELIDDGESVIAAKYGEECTSAPHALSARVAAEPPASSASGDVHLHHPGGGRTDVRGPFDGALLNMVQTANLSVNARFTFSNFTLAPEDPRADAVSEVRGSHLTAVYVLLALPGGTTVKIEYDCVARPYKPHVQVMVGGGAQQEPLDWILTTASEPLVLGTVSVAMHQAQPVELVAA